MDNMDKINIIMENELDRTGLIYGYILEREPDGSVKYNMRKDIVVKTNIRRDGNILTVNNVAEIDLERSKISLNEKDDDGELYHVIEFDNNGSMTYMLFPTDWLTKQPDSIKYEDVIKNDCFRTGKDSGISGKQINFV